MKNLDFQTETVKTRDNDGDVHESEVTFAHVDEDLAGTEVVLRNGESYKTRNGDVVVRDGNATDVFSRKQWEEMWTDSERVVQEGLDAEVVERTEDDADSNDPDSDVQDNDSVTASKAADSRDSASNADAKPTAVKSAASKAASSGKRN